MSEYQHVLEETAGTIDALYGSRLTHAPLSNLSTEMLRDMKFDLGMLIQVLERELATRGSPPKAT